MEWCNLYGPNNQPTLEEINEYINNELWDEFNSFVQNTYNIQPKLSYSSCSMQRGWNLKYQKSGKALCTLYPMENYFIALIVIGNKELQEAELFLPLSSKYTQELYKNSASSAMGCWLMMNVTDRSILDDVINLIQIRVKPKYETLNIKH